MKCDQLPEFKNKEINSTNSTDLPSPVEEKKVEEFRDYQEDTNVAKFYHENHLKQTFDFVQSKKNKFLPPKHLNLSIIEAVDLLNEVVDDSDPDNQRPQIVHLLQTAESAREAYPELKWFHLVGFIHDLGKILCHTKHFNEEQWCVVGDTFPVGCAFNENIVFPKYFKENPDFTNPNYNTKLGIYKENCGFDNVHFSWSHDEYMYQVCKAGECKIPEEGLYMIRYHSFYAWHNKGAYEYLADEKDRRFLKYLNMFQKCDLYSKVDDNINVNELLPYYLDLIREYFPNTNIMW